MLAHQARAGFRAPSGSAALRNGAVLDNNQIIDWPMASVRRLVPLHRVPSGRWPGLPRVRAILRRSSAGRARVVVRKVAEGLVQLAATPELKNQLLQGALRGLRRALAWAPGSRLVDLFSHGVGGYRAP